MSNTQANRLKYLLDQFAANTLEEPEFAELIELMGKGENEAEVKAALMGELEVQEAGSYNRLYWAEQFRKMNLTPTRSRKQGEEIPMRRMFNWKRIAVAASILLVVGLGSYFMFFNKADKPTTIATTQEERFKNDVDPGGYKAKLTLADGRIIVLDSVTSGELAKQGSTVVVNKDGQLVYQSGGNGNEVLYNTLSTAKGETYATVLADGSKVWLNSASSIKFPVSFSGNERKVEITGEAYFEVKKDASKQFTVSVNGMEVQVLGTHFNINAYSDEATIKTTLLEGSVEVKSEKIKVKIKPGEQANLRVNGELSIVNGADLEEVMAWKNGRFNFSSADIEVVMRQLSRWYDIDVVYANKMQLSFSGEMRRNTNLSEMLRAIELTGNVRFAIEGKKVTVMK